MEKHENRPSNLQSGWYLLGTGIGIGWLLGLSVSPVVSIVITSITGSAAALIAALSGLEDKTEQEPAANKRARFPTQWAVNPLPLAILVLGILIGSAFGVWARNHSWLGSEVTSEVTQWTRAGLTNAGWTQADIVRQLFESRYVSTGTMTNTTITAFPSTKNYGTVLFAVDASECQQLIAAAQLEDDAVLRNALASSTTTQLWQLPVIITDTATLKLVVEQVLCANG